MDTALTLASVPAVLAMVNLAKGLGIGGRWSAVLAVVLAVVISLAGQFWQGSPVYQAVASGLILGLSAAGLYDVSKTGGDAIGVD